MRKLLPALLLAPGMALAQAPATYPYLIRGEIGTLNAPAKVYLVRGTEAIDSATVKNG